MPADGVAMNAEAAKESPMRTRCVAVVSALIMSTGCWNTTAAPPLAAPRRSSSHVIAPTTPTAMSTVSVFLHQEPIAEDPIEHSAPPCGMLSDPEAHAALRDIVENWKEVDSRPLSMRDPTRLEPSIHVQHLLPRDEDDDLLIFHSTKDMHNDILVVLSPAATALYAVSSSKYAHLPVEIYCLEERAIGHDHKLHLTWRRVA